MNKNWWLVAIAFGAWGTVVMAMHHDLVWTIIGLVGVGFNINNYLSSSDDNDV